MVPAVIIRSPSPDLQRVAAVTGGHRIRRSTDDAGFDEALRRAQRFMDRIELSEQARAMLDAELAERR